jgi:hypothetical protein
MITAFIILFISLFMLIVGWHNLNHYDQLVPRPCGDAEYGVPTFIFPFKLIEEEKLILRYKIYFLVIGFAGAMYALSNLLKP